MIGWIQLSRQAVGQAEQALHGDERGVRDEIGFQVLHQAFADHFFPGTSVLHTRLDEGAGIVMECFGHMHAVLADPVIRRR